MHTNDYATMIEDFEAEQERQEIHDEMLAAGLL